MFSVSSSSGNKLLTTILAILLVSSGGMLRAQERRQTTNRRSTPDAAALTGVYRIDIPGSDKLYSVVAGASSNLPFGEQQRFFIDLAVRLTPPDLLAIERRGTRVTIGSSRAPRVTLLADGVTRAEHADDGHVVRSRVALDGGRLTFTSSGRTEDNFSVSFASIEGGARLRVTRRISAEQLNEPVIIQTFYHKISDVARWDIYGEARAARRDDAPATPGASSDTGRDASPAARVESREADALRGALGEWIEATNARDIERQMSFYMPELKAFYLARNASRASVRVEKARAFAAADLIEIRAEEPESIFRDGGRTAVMRFRKRYRIDDGPKSRRGEVIQELRWQRTARGWKIFSERDIRVLR
jgi:ketosteroid isomerase-like protein